MCSSKSLIRYCVCFFDQLANCIGKFRLNIIGKYMYIVANALHLMNILFSAVWLIIPIKEWASTQNREMESIQMCLDAATSFLSKWYKKSSFIFVDIVSKSTHTYYTKNIQPQARRLVMIKCLGVRQKMEGRDVSS